LSEEEIAFLMRCANEAEHCIEVVGWILKEISKLQVAQHSNSRMQSNSHLSVYSTSLCLSRRVSFMRNSEKTQQKAAAVAS
jgi:hypothetical protein